MNHTTVESPVMHTPVFAQYPGWKPDTFESVNVFTISQQTGSLVYYGPRALSDEATAPALLLFRPCSPAEQTVTLRHGDLVSVDGYRWRLHDAQPTFRLERTPCTH